MKRKVLCLVVILMMIFLLSCSNKSQPIERMRLPSTVQIGNIKYVIQTVPQSTIGGNWGVTSFDDCVIQVSNELSYDRQIRVLFHEINHALIYERQILPGNNDEEYQATALANAMIELFKNNKHLLQYINEMN